MRIRRANGGGLVISLVAMIDVLMILLVFFMVTSTYLNLDMVPLAGAPDAPDPPDASAEPEAGTAPQIPERLMIRLGGDGLAYVGGRAVTGRDLSGLLADRLSARPDLDVIVLPSGQASVQALAALMDVAVSAGATRLRIVRLDAAR